MKLIRRNINGIDIAMRPGILNKLWGDIMVFQKENDIVVKTHSDQKEYLIKDTHIQECVQLVNEDDPDGKLLTAMCKAGWKTNKLADYIPLIKKPT